MATTLTAGWRLGPYEVVAPIGSGGMGEVYRARDARLGREVAVKVLPTSFAADEARLRRFEQEARAVAALNHPNILAVYDIGAHEGTPYVVSELLEGETLRARLDGSPLPARKAIDYAGQMARGLAAAHAKGIVHRDLKPDNIFITRDGRVKILDFGLAKMTFAEPAADETGLVTLGGPQTGAGVVLGTVGYMSPEQIRAQPVDHRSDIFSFGAVLFEMLSGARAFKAESAVETMNAILKADVPRLSETDRKIPPALEQIVTHCLEKNPEERFQSAQDIAFHLESVSQHSTIHTAILPAMAPAAPRRWRWIAAALLLIGAAVGLFFAGRSTAPHIEPTFMPLTFQRGHITSARFAPDGRTVVYTASWDGGAAGLYTAQPGNPESRALEVQGEVAGVSSGGEMALLVPRPDRGLVLARAPLGGGAPREVLDGVDAADWGRDGDSFAVLRTEAGRQRLEFPIGKVLYQADGWMSHIRVSPSGSHIAFGDHPVQIDNRGDVAIVDLQGTKTTLSTGWEDIGRIAWSPDGREVWFSASSSGTDHTLYAVTLDGRRRTLLTAPGNLGLHDVAADGRVIITQGGRRPAAVALAPGATEERELAWMDYSWFSDLSEDGRQVLLSEQGVAGGPGYAVYLRGTDGSPAVRLGKGDAHSLSHDGQWALATDLGTHTLQMLPTGAGQPRTIPAHGIDSYAWAGFFPDDRRILFLGAEKGKGNRMYAQDLDGGAPRAITDEGVGARRNTLSPDAAWIAASRAGVLQLYPVGGGAPRDIAGTERGDVAIRWKADGQVLYVRNGARPVKIFAIDVAKGTRTQLFELSPRDRVGTSGIVEIRLTPDGKSYAYGYLRTLNSLYQVDGLR